MSPATQAQGSLRFRNGLPLNSVFRSSRWIASFGNPAGKVPPPEVCREQLSRLLQSDAWVLDGVSLLGRQKANLIVFLDFPRRVCAWRCAQRNWRYLFSSRPGLPDGCPEWRIVPTLAKIIMDFPNKARPVILKDIAASEGNGVVIQGAADLANFIKGIPLLQSQTHL